MEETKRELVRLCMDHPEGLSIFKLHSLYLRTCNKPLDLGGSNRLSALETLLRSMPTQLRFSSTGGLTVWPITPLKTAVDSSSSTCSSSSSSSATAVAGKSLSAPGKDHSSTHDGSKAFRLQRLRGEVLTMLASSPGGVEVPKLRAHYKQMYSRRLILAEYGLEGLQELFTDLGDSVSVERVDKRNMVRLRDPRGQREHSQQGPAKERKRREERKEEEKDVNTNLTGALPRTSAMSDTEKVRGKIVAMMKQHPEGIPLNKLAVAYSQTYHKNLTLSALGFSSIASLVDSLDRELCVEGKLVFHKSHRAQTGAPAQAGGSQHETPPRPDSRSGKDPPLTPLKHGARPGKDPPLTPLNHGARPEKDPPSTATSSHRSGSESPQPSAGSHYGPPPTSGSSFGVLSPSPAPSFTSRSSPLLSFSSAMKLTEDLTKEQLLERVREVIKEYPPAATSMVQLQNGYFLRFGLPLSVPLYKSLYDSQEPSTPADQGGTEAEKPAATPKLADSKKRDTAPSTILANGHIVHVVRPKTGTPLQHTPSASPVPSPSPLLSQTPQPGAAISDSDFPALGLGEVKLTKTQERRLRTRGQREGNSPVYREAYHAQLREVHGATVRAAEALMSEEEEDGNERRRRRRNALDPDVVNSLVEDVIRDISAEGELVTKEKVILRVCRLLQVPSLDAGSIDLRWQIPALKDLQRTVREIHMFIESVETASSVCTLYELGLSLAGLKNKKRYEELNMGPLCKLPLVHRLFKIDSNTKDDDIHQIETVDILKSLREFRRHLNKPKVDLAEFMKHLADQYSCDSPYELGIRINSVGLPLATLSKVTSCERACLEQGQKAILMEIEEEVQERMRKMKRSLMEQAQGPVLFSSIGSSELRKKYVTMTAAEAVLEVFTNAMGVFSTKMTKCVMDFLLKVSGDRLARALFQLAICGGSLAAPQDLVPKDKPPKHPENTRTENGPRTPPPSEATVKQFLKDSLSNHSNAFTLAHVASLERKLAKQFQVTEFTSLEQGTFLEFLVKQTQVLQEAVGGAVSLRSSSVEGQSCGFRPSRQDVFEFIKQCGALTATDQEGLAHVETALRAHYGVRDSRDLGFGQLRNLVGLVQRQRELSMGGGASQVRYESALFAKDPSSSSSSVGEAVGLLGEVSQTQALASLLSCPLLEDMGQWSQWELVFRPIYGPLKDFIDRKAGNTDLAALEVSPGLLLRVTTSTGDKFFSQAAMTLDPVGTAGHLVSIVAADGIANAPTALLANHMESSLAAAVAQEDLTGSEEGGPCFRTVAQFILDCLIRIPTRTCRALLQQVFLEPFSRVLGQVKSKAVLLGTARSDPRYLNCLHQLGIVLGITDWVKDYHSKLSPPQNQPKTQTAPLDQNKSAMVDSVSGSLSALNLSEDEDSQVDYSSDSSHPNQAQSGADDDEEEKEDDDDEVKEEEDEEELYELTSIPNGTSDTPVDGEGREEEGELSLAETEEGDTANSQSESKVNVHMAIIDDIRKSEFGIGVELNAEGQRLMLVQQERLGRSLDRLSTELYSKDTHFVLELIQNADDNSYPSEGGAVPALAFMVERDCVTILNNECGFLERNVRAICDVGRSTKGKHSSGYIGQKGIGFKSVFKVTDCPEIHSNGFHLRFDKTSGPMGYILPHWVDDERPLDMSHMTEHCWTTKICLPLRSESYQTRNLFHDVHPSLLLFLHRLRSITIYNQSEKRLVTMTRRDLNDNVLEVEHPDGTERWLVVKRTLHPRKIKDDVESTELALAFQLSDDVTGSDIRAQPQKQPVFAYLPLRSFGFRFIIQGDFDIPSSREDVDRDSSWNQWLRSETPQLFLHAMEVFTVHPEFSGLRGLCHFLQFVPLPDEVLDFFKPVAGQIIQLLKGKAFLPVINTEGEVEYKLPSQVAVCQDAVIRDVIGKEELDRHLSLAYLHPGLVPAPPLSLLTHLGVRPLRGSDVTTVTTAMAKELLQGDGINSDSGLRRLARLLVCNFRALEQGYGEADAILNTLRDLPIIPLADGRVVALNGEGVFFPMAESRSTGIKSHSTGPLGALYRDVSVVHPSLLSCVEPLEGEQVRELLKRLGVHELEPQQLLQQHIYPALRNDTWKAKPEAVVVSYLVFIKQHSSSSLEYTNTDMTVPVLTTRGLLCPAQAGVHFSKEYGNMDLPSMLPGCDWVLLSPCYVETDGDVAGWRELFTVLGVRDRLIIRKERRTLTDKELASSPWAVESELWPCGAGRARGPEGGCVLDDYPSEEFLSLVTAELPAPTLLKQRKALLELLETNWDTGDRYSQYLTAQVIDSDGQPIKSTKSSFFASLSRLPWVPAYRLQAGGGRKEEHLCPKAVYLFSPEVYSLLGTHVSYVDMNPSEMTTALGMRHSVSIDELIGYLKKWCVRTNSAIGPEEQKQEELEGSEFTSTGQHILNVYSYLHGNCSQASMKELFQHTPAVFIEFQRREDWCSGRFYHLKEVCWSDPTGMFQRYRELTRASDSTVQEPKVLAPFYSQLDGMRDLFSRLLGVEPSPSMNQYVGLLELVCLSSPLPTADVLQDVSVLYARLADKCKTPGPGDQEHTTQINPSYCSTLKGMLLDKRVFPTKDNCWVTLARRPMIPDSKELEKMFKSHREVCLLNLPPADKKTAPRTKTGPPHHRSMGGERASVFSEEDRALFLEICGVPRLSQCASTEALTENYRPCPSMQALVRSVVPYIQRFLYHHDELAELYWELQENHIAQSIRQLSYGQVGMLYIRHLLTVSEEEQPVVEMEDVICLLKDRKELYIQKDHLSAKLDICRELVKLFCTESSHRKELVLFLGGLVTSLNDPAALKRFLKKEDIRELPSKEEPWEVPEPLVPETKPDRVFSGGQRAVSAPEEEPRPGQQDGEQTLMCWPPRSSLSNTAAIRTGGGAASVVETVLKMWPPPAEPIDSIRDPERDRTPRESSHDAALGLSSHDATPRLGTLDRAVDHLSPHRDHLATTSSPHPTEANQESGVRVGQATDLALQGSPGRGESEEERFNTARPSQHPGAPAPDRHRPDPDQHSTNNQQHPPSCGAVPDVVVPSVFQGAGGVGDFEQRPPLALDFPVWDKSQTPQAFLEDLELNCQRPTTVSFADNPDAAAIGAWGEQLVHSFLTHWRDSGEPGCPTHITWYNQHAESGRPSDFKLTFDLEEGEQQGSGEEGQRAGIEVYVEVKSTVKRDRSFIYLSANELDLALRVKERYHLFRVYNAGDAQNVRLCRIQNLAQHLHSKEVDLFMFV